MRRKQKRGKGGVGTKLDRKGTTETLERVYAHDRLLFTEVVKI